MHIQGDEERWSKGGKGYLTVSVFRQPFTAVSTALCAMMGSRREFVYPTLTNARRGTQSSNLRPKDLFQV